MRSGDCRGFAADATLPVGVKDVTQLNGDIFGVEYDAKFIGAWRLLEGLNTDLYSPMSSAPPRSRVSLVLATVVLIVAAGPFCSSAFRSLILNRVILPNLLVVLSASVTYGFSIASFDCEVRGTRLVSRIYLEISTLLINLIMMGRLMGGFARQKGLGIGSIKSLQTRTALLVDIPDTSVERELDIDVRLLQFGDISRVKTSSPVATDGTSVSEVSEFDESVVT